MEPQSCDLVIKYGFKTVSPGYDSCNSFKKGMGLFKSGHVLNVTEYRIRNPAATFITSTVVRQTSVNLPPYDVKIEINEDRLAVQRECSCAAGAGGVCKHIGATLAYINAHSGLSKTDEPQAWGRPKPSTSSNTPNLQSVKDKYSKCRRAEDIWPSKRIKIDNIKVHNVSSGDLYSIPCVLRDMLSAEERSEASIICSYICNDIVNGVVSSYVESACRVTIKNILANHSQSLSVGTTSLDHIQFNCQEIKDFFQREIFVNCKEIEECAIKTVEQHNSNEWHARRKNRISASSKAHSIKTRRKDFDKLAEQFVNPKPFSGNTATRYGVKMERIACEKYEQLYGVKVVHCGLIIHPTQHWLCASPDGIVVEGTHMKIIEIKCPYKCEKKKIIEDGQINLPYLENKDGKLVLKESHIYFTQCQMLLYVSGLQECDLFMYSPLQTQVVTVIRNNTYLQKVLPKIENFYFKHLLPKIIKR